MLVSEFIIKLFTAGSKLSSKRFFGAVGWVVCLIVVLYCTVANQQAPLVLDSIIIASTTLLGIDSVTRIWQKKQ